MTAKNHIGKFLLASALMFGMGLHASAYNGLWHTVPSENVPASGARSLQPDKYLVFAMNTEALKSSLSTLSEDPEIAKVFELPMPNGSFRSFKVWQTATMAPELGAKYPQIKTFNAVATDNSNVTAKLDYTIYGFHAMVYDGANTFFIDPYSNVSDGFYLCYYKHDYTKRTAGFVACGVKDEREDELGDGRMNIANGGQNPQLALVNGLAKRTYRLALACTADYASVVTGGNPTKPGVLSAMVTTMNRVNGVYEKDMAITMQLIANNDDIIYLSKPDPFPSGSQGDNQSNMNTTIGAANYDIGHLFKKSLGGISDLGCVCNDSRKARSVTGQPNPVGDPFDLDYVAHEMGHQFGAEHTFNASTGSCSGNGVFDRAYEPGSGSTLMAYAGICNSNNDIAKNSSAYFHATSLQQLTEFITVGIGASCGSVTPSGNTPAIVPPFAKNRDIPKLTPFELEAPEAVDADHQSLTYCWEEWDLDEFGADFSATTLGPIFRSFDPTTSRTRVFPTTEKLINNVNSYLGEKLPNVGRNMIFKLTVRDVNNGVGAINFPDDEVTLQVDGNSGPFLVTAPNKATDYWQMGSTQTVTWDVANTTAGSVNCQSVDIFLSLDGGRTYTETLLTGTPNDGSETITVPNTPTASARVKVKGANNVFFDISNHDFKINSWPAAVKDVSTATQVNIYPVPAADVLHIDLEGNRQYRMELSSTLGQSVWSGTASKQNTVNVAGWAKGIYQLQLTDIQTREKTVKKFLVQ